MLLVWAGPEVAVLEHTTSLAILPTPFHKHTSTFWTSVSIEYFAKGRKQIFQSFTLHTPYENRTFFWTDLQQLAFGTPFPRPRLHVQFIQGDNTIVLRLLPHYHHTEHDWSNKEMLHKSFWILCWPCLETPEAPVQGETVTSLRMLQSLLLYTLPPRHPWQFSVKSSSDAFQSHITSNRAGK